MKKKVICGISLLLFAFTLQGFKQDNEPITKEDGMYITIRCGFAGIYQRLDRYKDGKWQLIVLDGSKVIAYSKNKVEL